MYKIVFILLFLSSCDVCFATYAKGQSVDTLPQPAQPLEAIHFHFDRAVYAPGEMMWFKVYLRQQGRSRILSRNLYVEMVDDSGAVIKHLILPISESGITAGHFSIPAAYRYGGLHVIAYTKRLLHQDVASSYQHSIPILQEDVPAQRSVLTGPARIDFFPEGGEMINGVPATVAFIATGKGGIPLAGSGYIRNDSGDQVAHFETQHQGMGDFMFTPHEGASYTAVWHTPNGSELVTALPAIQSIGIGLHVYDSANGKAFTITPSLGIPSDLQVVHVIATFQGGVIYKATASMSGGSAITGLIPTEDLRSGGMVITVYSASWQPLAERLSFIDHMAADTFAIQLAMEQTNYLKRGMNEMLLTLPDSNVANLSVAITDGTLGQDSARACSIFSDLLLAGELRGTVYNAASYFQGDSAVSAARLDLVMLTHGWRRYKHPAVHADPGNNIDSTYLTLSGSLQQLRASHIKGLKNIFFVLKHIDGVTQSMLVPLDEQGHFNLPQVFLFDSTKLYYKIPGNKQSQSNTALVLAQPDDARMKASDIGELLQSHFPFSADINGQLAADYQLFKTSGMASGHLLTGITMKTHKKTKLEQMDDFYVKNQLFKGSGAMNVYALDVSHDKSAIGYLNIFSYLQAHIPGLVADGGGVYFARDRSTVINYATLFVDEMPGADAEGVPMMDIAYIKAFPAPFVGAPLNGSAIVIYTKKGSELEEQATDSLPFLTVHGYDNLKEFYAPDYTQSDTLTKDPDTRLTLYWAPVVLTNARQKTIRIKFFNNDFTHVFRIVVEGMDVNGKLGRVERMISPVK